MLLDFRLESNRIFESLLFELEFDFEEQFEEILNRQRSIRRTVTLKVTVTLVGKFWDRSAGNKIQNAGPAPSVLCANKSQTNTG